MPFKELAIIVGFFAAMWLIWFATGGPERGMNTSSQDRGLFSAPVFSAPQFKFQVQALRTPRGTFNTPTNTPSANTELSERERNLLETELRRIGARIDQTETSPYRSLVEIELVTKHATTPHQEYLLLSVSPRVSEKIPLTNWEVRSLVTGKSGTIKKGSYLPFIGERITEETIFLNPGARIYVTTGRSPIGSSFRTNLCTGYFAQFQSFTPPLARTCPRLIDSSLPEFPNAFNDTCLDYLQSIPNCTVPLRGLPLTLSPACKAFINERANYHTCINEHKENASFYRNEWRVYLGRDTELWKNEREAIQLIDHNGKVVDTLIY